MFLGWIKLHRRIMDWNWYTEPNTAHLFVHLLLKANVTNRIWQNQSISRGEVITSLNSLSEQTGISKDKIRTILKRLERGGEIKCQKTNKYTLIHIEKYELYQGTEENTPSQLPHKNHNTPKELPTVKEGEKVKILKCKNISKPKDEGLRSFASILTAKYNVERVPPTLDEVNAYCIDKGIEMNTEKFWHWYDNNNWQDKDGRKMREWHYALHRWHARQQNWSDGE